MAEKKKKKKRVRREIVRNKNRLLKGKDLLYLRILSFLILGVFVAAFAVTGFFLFSHRQEAAERQDIFDEAFAEEEQAEIVSEVMHEGILKGIVSAAQGVRDALRERPEEMEVPTDQLGSFASLDGVKIAEGGKVVVSLSAPGLPVSDDKYYYLFEEKIWEDSGTEGREPLTRTYKDAEVELTVDLNRGSADSRLNSRFYLAVKRDGTYRPVCHARYVENPEALASYNYSGTSHASKKGLLIDPTKSTGGEWDDLGVQYCTYNFPLSHILGGTSNAAYPTIAYNYHGKTWYFNGAHIHQYDYLFSTLTRKGIDITGIILDDASTAAYPAFTHPSARSGSTAPYYMFNGVTEDGVEAIGALATFLAGRYTGGDHGRVQNWIIGNEVNARKEWNYMPSGTGLSEYTEAYAKAYRVFYNGIKSVNAGAGVYICLDQQWNRSKKNNPDYNARELLDSFAVTIRDFGDINWGLAYHPYSCPLTQPAFWKATNNVKQSVDSPFITMNNIGILTNYMHQDRFLTKSGQVRSIILSEQGFTSTSGQDVQAAAVAYAYKIAAANPDIDIFIYARESDHAVEVAQKLALGLNDTGGGHKRSYNVYKHMDKADASSVIDFALGIIGISRWP